MVTEAQKRASAKWKKANVRQKILKFYIGRDDELLEHLAKQPRQNEYMLNLIRADMERSGDDAE